VAVDREPLGRFALVLPERLARARIERDDPIARGAEIDGIAAEFRQAFDGAAALV
jgi:hypothetical protein